jgi:rRNA maturation protein Nop10
MLHILRREDGTYTLSEKDEDGVAVSPRPPKYSPEDPYGKYRRQAKEQERKEKGLL